VKSPRPSVPRTIPCPRSFGSSSMFTSTRIYLSASEQNRQRASYATTTTTFLCSISRNSHHRNTLHAAFAETLRLRTHGVIPRQLRDGLTINGWSMSRHSLVAIPSTIAHMDQTFWSHRDRGSESVWEFSPTRFLRLGEAKSPGTFSMSEPKDPGFPSVLGCVRVLDVAS
jgi:hypothetical protein